MPKLPLPEVMASMRSFWAQRPQPTHVQAYYGLQAVKDANNLLTSSDMDIVWGGLYQKNEYLPDEYCEYVVLQRLMWKSLSKVPPTSLKRTVDAIASSAETLAENLHVYRREISLTVGHPLALPELLTIAAVDHVHKRGKRLRKTSTHEGSPLVARRFRSSSLYISIPDILNALAKRLRDTQPSEMALAHRGKPNDINAERTFVVKRLGQFLIFHFNQPRTDWISRTVNVLFPKPGRGGPVDAVHVRHLLRPPR